MADYKAVVPSTWSREATFDYLADFRNVAEWDPSIEKVVLTAGEPGLVGAEYDVTFTMAGRETTMPYVALLVERPERIIMRGETDAVTSIDTITVNERVEGSQVGYHAELELKGVRKLAEPVAEFALTRASNKAKDGLTEKLAMPPSEGE